MAMLEQRAQEQFLGALRSLVYVTTGTHEAAACFEAVNQFSAPSILR